MKVTLVFLAAVAAMVAFAASPARSTVFAPSTPVWHPKAADLTEFLDTYATASSPSASSLLSAMPTSFVQLRNKFILALQGFASSWSSSPSATPKKDNDNYFGFIPPLQGSALPGGAAASWSAPCFNQTSASLSADGKTLTVTVEQPTSLFCSDFYLLGTVSGVKLHTFATRGTHTIAWSMPADASAAEQWDLQAKGVRFFRFYGGMSQMITDLLDTALLFEPEATKGVSQAAAARNVDFMARYAQFPMEKRATQSVSIDPSTVHSGDFFGVVRLDGLDPMLAWAMGSTTGHTTVALWIDNELYIAESTVKDSYWPVDGIQKTPFAQWVKQAREAGYQVVHTPLDAKYRAMFNETAAALKLQEIEGFEYGYRNLLFGWIDTVTDNYPCLPPDYKQCLEWSHFEILFSAVDRLAPSVSNMIINQALNLRLQTSGLGMADILFQANKQGIAADTLPTMIELDSYVYNTTRYGKPAMGPSMVCCVFVCNMWKAGGLFKSLDDEVNCAELTNWDDYVLDIFDTTTPVPPQCEKADPGIPYCQIEGEYTLRLNDYSTKAPYKHMAEHCPSLAPKYNKSSTC